MRGASWLAGLAVACCLIPLADAQLVFNQVAAPPPIQPSSGPGIAVVGVTYRCSSPTEMRLQDTVLRFNAVEGPPGVTVTGPNEVRVPQSACQGTLSQTWRQNLEFHIQATPHARGETPLAFLLQGNVPGDVSAAPATGSVMVPFSVGYHGLIAAEAPAPVAQAPRGRELRYEIKLTNLGNANTDVESVLVGAVPAGWQVRLPTPTILGPSPESGGRDANRSVMFNVLVPTDEAAANETAFQLRFTPRSTIDASQAGPSVTVSVLARVQPCDPNQKDAATQATCDTKAGKSLTAPGAGPLVLLGIFACALVARRRFA